MEHPEQSTVRMQSGKSLLECEAVEVGPNTRVYHSALGELRGFEFYVARFSSGPCDVDADALMAHPETCVECLFHGVAYFDGVRHLYMGDEVCGNVGYLYYASPARLERVFGVLRGLVARYCDYDTDWDADADGQNPRKEDA